MTTFSFKSLTSEHISLLHQWMQHPHVWQWWGEGRSWSLDQVQAEYRSHTEGYKIEKGERRPIHPFIIYFQERPIGFIQSYNALHFPREDFKVEDLWRDTTKSLAALDFYIGETDCLGKGLGAEALKAFLQQYVFPKFDACLVDPDKSNKIAIRAYAKAGFSTNLELSSSVIMIAQKEAIKNPLIIFGSARSDGNTLQAIQALIGDQSVPIVDLGKLNIAHYDYDYQNTHDDFIPLAEKMVMHNPIILATPVYWYTMSALMKTFMDRWSDLLDIRKDLGRRLTNKELYVIASYGGVKPEGFEFPFSQTCAYLEMQYKGCFYFYSGDDPELIKENAIAVAPNFTQSLSNWMGSGAKPDSYP